MSQLAIPKKLAPVLEELDSLTQRASVKQLRAMLESADISLEDVEQFAHFSEKNYRRNLVQAGTWYHMLILCWKSGQRSPIHNHAASSCGLKVLSGIATETVFDFSPCGQVRATSSLDMPAGKIAATQCSDTHQISNLQAANQDLVTLHIYSPPLLEMDQFSITAPTVEKFTPELFVHTDGSGI
jgi:cysteine dioxygenase